MAWAEVWRRKGLMWALVLKPLSLIYALAWAVGKLVKPGRPVSSSVPVISVGNLSVGGTGKSPLVRALAARALSRRLVPAILLRGYGARPGTRPLRVSAGNGPLVTCADAGDEASEHARESSASVWVDTDRRRSAAASIAEGATALILDDGFQRRGQLRRNLDLLLADWQEIQQGEHWLPAGPWREPWTQIAAADMVLVSGAPAELHGDALRLSLPTVWREKPVFRLDRLVTGLQSWPEGRTLPLSNLADKHVLALSGLGRPQSFEQSLAALGATPQSWRFKDHHAFKTAELALPQTHAVAVVTTAKDAVRLPADWHPSLPVWVLRVEARVSPGKAFWDKVDQVFSAPFSKGRGPWAS